MTGVLGYFQFLLILGYPVRLLGVTRSHLFAAVRSLANAA